MTQSDNRDILHLRLAARSLLEWQTPRQSKYYRDVMIDLIGQSAIAKSRGLSESHPILDLDERGSLLWYLSETLTSEVPEIPEIISEQETTEHFVTRAIAAFESAGDIDTFANPFLRHLDIDETLDVILAGLKDRSAQVNGLAVSLLLSISTPLAHREQANYFVDLTDQRLAFTPMFRRLRQRSRFLYRTLPDLLAWVVIVSTLIFMGRNSYNPENTMALLSDPVSVTSMILIATLVLAVILARAFRRAMMAAFSRALLATSGLIPVVRETITSEHCAKRLPEVFRRECASNVNLWRSIVSSFEDGGVWRRILFAGVATPSASVVVASMRILEDSSIDYRIRAEVFSWLCRIELYRYRSTT